MPRKQKKQWAPAKKARTAITSGKMLAVDPASGSSSQAGWALYETGKLVEAGVVEVSKGKCIGDRLQETYEALCEDEVDVLAIERIRGRMAHQYLHWAVGTIVAAVPYKHLVEVPIPVWRAYAKASGRWDKADDQDAIMIGEVCIHLAGKVDK